MKRIDQNTNSLITAKKIAILVMVFLFISFCSSAQIAIVVNKSNTIEDVSLDQVKSLFLGKSMYFENKMPVTLCDFAPDKTAFCEKTFEFSEKKMNQLWFQLIFSGSAAKPPVAFNSLDKLIEYINDNEGAIAYIDLSKIAGVEEIKILMVDGVLPGNEGYILSVIDVVCPECLTYYYNDQ